MYNSKRGIALLITLALILFCSFLIVDSYTILNRKINDSVQNRALIESQVILKNIRDILDALAKDIKNPITLDMVFTSPIEFEETRNLGLHIKIKSGVTKFNINKIYSNGQKNVPYYEFLDKLLDKYEIKDKTLFFNIILDTLDTNSSNVERSDGSKIVLYDQFFRTGKIYNMRHFMQIIDYYISKTGDNSIRNIPWSGIIDTTTDIVDFNYISVDYLKELFPDYTDDAIETLRLSESGDFCKNIDEVEIPQKDRDRLKALGIGCYIKNIVCSVELIDSNVSKNFSFHYDINNKKVYEFEIGF
jgi:hypothetical protein